MSRSSNTAARREQIALSAKYLLATAGYEGATTAEIARHAGLAPGLVHYHFASKEAVLIAVAELVAAGLAARVASRQRAARQTALDQLNALLDAHVALGADADPAAVAAWCVVVDEAARRPLVREAVQRLLGSASLGLQAALLAVAPQADGGAAAAALLAAIHGYWQLVRLDAGLVPMGSAQAGLRAMARGLLFSPEECS